MFIEAKTRFLALFEDFFKKGGELPPNPNSFLADLVLEKLSVSLAKIFGKEDEIGCKWKKIPAVLHAYLMSFFNCIMLQAVFKSMRN